MFTGYVGAGLLDAASIGDVFASPSAEQMAAACRRADGGAGVVMIYGNYGGDLMNFGMAAEVLELEDDLETAQVLLADDVASAAPAEAAKRRGVAGMVYAFKIAGAAAEERRDLAEVARIAKLTANSCRSIGIALTPCVVPRAGAPTSTLGENEMEMGMSIHGEPASGALRSNPPTRSWMRCSTACWPIILCQEAIAPLCLSIRSARRLPKSSTSYIAACASEWTR